MNTKKIFAATLAVMSLMMMSGCDKNKTPGGQQQNGDNNNNPAQTLAIPDNVVVNTENMATTPPTDVVTPEDTSGAGSEGSASEETFTTEPAMPDPDDIMTKPGTDFDNFDNVTTKAGFTGSKSEYEKIITESKAAMDNAEGFKVDCTVIGIIPVDNGASSRLVNHSYTYEITTDATHLTSKTEDSNDPSKNTDYEEFQKFDDSVIATYTVNSDGYWCDSIPKIFSRDNMVISSIRSFGFLEAFNDPMTFESADVTQEDGKYTIYIDWYKMNIEEDDQISGYNLFGGMIRALDIDDSLLGMDPYDMNGGITYVLDENYYPVSITADITSNRIPDKCDMHVSMNFRNWNNVRRISIPYTNTKAESETSAPAETSATEPTTMIVVDPAESQGQSADVPPPAVTTAASPAETSVSETDAT